MQIATRASASITFGKPARSRRQTRPVPAAAAPAPPDSQPWPPVSDRVLRSTPSALPPGACLDQLAAAVPDEQRWHGDARMVAAIASAVVENRTGFRVFALRALPPDEHGREIAVRAGDSLPPSRRYDEHGNPAEGLARGAAAFGFKDRLGLSAAIGLIAWQPGRQVALIAGGAALRSDEPHTHIILQPVALAIWLRRYSGLGRFSPYVEHADFE